MIEAVERLCYKKLCDFSVHKLKYVGMENIVKYLVSVEAINI